MYYVRYYHNGVYNNVGSFRTLDKALYFIKYNYVIYGIDIKLFQICHKGMVITLNENTIKKIFK